MQASTPQSPSNWLNTLGILIAILIAITLFVLTIENMGLIHLRMPSKAVAPESVPVHVKDFQFTESELRVKAGETVTLNLINSDVLIHSFDLDEFDIHAEMPKKENSTIRFTPTQPGVYTFYCGVPGHREAGMVGTLVVEP